MKFRILTLPIALLTLSLAAEAQAASRRALLPTLPGEERAIPTRPEFLRTRAVALTPEFASALRGGDLRAEPWSFPFFDDFAVTLRVDRQEEGLYGALVVSGGVEGDPRASFHLAFQGGALCAHLRDGAGRDFGVRLLEGSTHFAVESDPRRMRGCAARARAHPGAVPGPGGLGGITGTGSLYGPDVLIVYTANARQAAGSHAAMLAAIEVAIAEGNTALMASLADSSTTVLFDLVGVAEVDYDETGWSMSTHLNALDGDHMFLEVPDVHGWRDIAGADMVSMVVDDPTDPAAGIANIMLFPTTMFAGSAFSVCDYGAVVTNYTLPHELGHNMGCAHNPEDADEGCYSYSFGHQFKGSSGSDWRTVMAYKPGTRILRFSNPGVTYDGVATGTSSRDNGRSIENTAATVSSFRSSTVKLSTVYVNPAYPGGTFFPEVGTQAFPFNTVQEGLFKVGTGGTIQLQGGTASGEHFFAQDVRIDASALSTIGG